MRNRTRSIVAALSALTLATAAGGVASAQGLFGSAGEVGSSGILGSLGDFGSLGSLGKPTIPGDGTFPVGNGFDGTVKPGIYQNPGLPDVTCQWERTSPLIFGFSRFTSPLPPYQFATAVIIEPTDTEFETNDCAEWKWVAPVPQSTRSAGSTGSAGSFEKPTIPGNGTFDPSAGEVEPGIYQNPGITDLSCEWERVGPNFETGYELDPAPGQQVASAVIIEPTDTEFTTTDCAEWEWVAPVPGSTGSLGSS
ncbi:hypothetical protein BFN03_04265 [Rhodococcus sp. WMMA185]|uniref:hypothetical protein n=1 Tax=Rhodococcus sp. WMMA185 TaxID=679318 RepID=UPI000878F967|nr:hypothetical protein [Rhodococcus sp. WMMA185]AOW92188.1 hypothetical protein BFN03_04265 [Rhodococcus sp. WMMA185]